MAQITGLKKLNANIRRLQNEAKQDNCVVMVGYTAAYAVYVHENLEARHAPGKVARYLAIPFEKMQDEILKMVKTAVSNKGSIKSTLLRAGYMIQRESQKIVPVDTGNLRGSAFTRLK